MESVFLGRQPILDNNGNLYAYEILFRDSAQNRAVVDDAMYATSKTLQSILDIFGIEGVLGRYLGFINVDHTFITSDMVELIPRDRFVLEIVEDTIVDDDLIKRVEDLSGNGYSFALDDFTFDDEYLQSFKPLFKTAAYIKVDLRKTGTDCLPTKVYHLKKHRAKLLAEKVEEHQEFDFCKRIGFSYYQGYFFEKPQVMTAKAVDPSKLAVIKLINLIYRGAAIERIEEIFQLNPDLSYKLLKFINSPVFCLRSHITSIRHAISLLGLKPLLNWLVLLSYAGSKKGMVNPLFQSAVIRAKTMENLINRIAGSRDAAESAFLVGLLSLIDSVYHLPKETILEQLALNDEITRAVLAFEGTYGKVLKLFIAAERVRLEEVEGLLQELGIPAEALSDAKLQSYAWLNQIVSSQAS